LRKISNGLVSSHCGTTDSGSAIGALTSAQFYGPQGIITAPNDNIYLADRLNHCIRKISGGQVTTFAGICGTSGSANEDGHCIRRISNGQVSTFPATCGVAGITNGATTSSSFSGIFSVSVDPMGNIYASDRLNHCIRKISPVCTTGKQFRIMRVWDFFQLCNQLLR